MIQDAMWSLGSGSQGNAILVAYGRTRVLIDMGLRPRQVADRLAMLGLSPADLTAALISHEHRDHIGGLLLLRRFSRVACYANRFTVEGIEREIGFLPERLCVFANGEPFRIGDIEVNPFSVPHDALDPVGFDLRLDAMRITVATDLGSATALVRERLRGSDLIVIEANHDEEMLKRSRRPWPLKQRILARTGHLSNAAAAQLLAETLDAPPRLVLLAHVSRECNTPELARRSVSEGLTAAGHRLVPLAVADQDVVSDRFALS